MESVAPATSFAGGLDSGGRMVAEAQARHTGVEGSRQGNQARRVAGRDTGNTRQSSEQEG